MLYVPILTIILHRAERLNAGMIMNERMVRLLCLLWLKKTLL
jgi:hypothetical protein